MSLSYNKLYYYNKAKYINLRNNIDNIIVNVEIDNTNDNSFYFIDNSDSSDNSNSSDSSDNSDSSDLSDGSDGSDGSDSSDNVDSYDLDSSDSDSYDSSDSDSSSYIIHHNGGKNDKKWDSLQHAGVMFHPMYESHGTPLKYDKQKLVLNDEAEEFASYYVNPRYDKYKNDKFNKNFFKDWRTTLTDELKEIITDFDKCDFTLIEKYVKKDIENKKLIRENKSKEEKQREKEEKKLKSTKYSIAIVDGKEQTIDNFMVEPPSIFMGRGNHPLTGSLKKRIYPKDITLNVGPNMDIPEIDFDNENNDRNWGSIISDNTLEWIASWQNSVTNKTNYARFGRKSDFKMKSDESKFDLAKKLKYKIKKIRDQNEIYLRDEDEEKRQLATSLFLIDRLALRAGNEKRSDQADTVGVTTLKVKNVSLFDDSKKIIKLDFLGKDSIRYMNKFNVPDDVYNNIKEFIKNKSSKDMVFDLVSSESLNKYIKGYMKKLTSKVFRTYNASNLMQIELRKIVANMKDYDETDRIKKIKYMYDMANINVAALCNHQKMSNTDNSKRIEAIDEKIHKQKLEINKLNRQRRKKIDEGKSTKAINKRLESKKKKMEELRNKKKLIEKGKNLSTGTSKTNYIDPRITIAFIKKLNLEEHIDKFFNKSQQKNFEWAMNTDETYSF